MVTFLTRKLIYIKNSLFANISLRTNREGGNNQHNRMAAPVIFIRFCLFYRNFKLDSIMIACRSGKLENKCTVQSHLNNLARPTVFFVKWKCSKNKEKSVALKSR